MAWLGRARQASPVQRLLCWSWGSQPQISALASELAEELQPQACQEQRRWMAVPKRKAGLCCRRRPARLLLCVRPCAVQLSPHRRGMRNQHKAMAKLENVAMCR